MRWGVTIYGQVELSLCPVDKRGLPLGLHVEPRHRRRGVGRMLARAAAARGGRFSWTATRQRSRAWPRSGPPRGREHRRTGVRTKRRPDYASNRGARRRES
ncbi:hypothetical protein [Amycolatopsis sp. NBC_00438]|uniref:hypothetical protein n=1 Tax=Amycolatopsis sp. NBC_00438 TaxID=2903558 RepID=UPI003FA486F2